MIGRETAPGRVLVTGARGFIGAHAVRALTEAGYVVHAVTSRKTAEPSAPTGVRWHIADLRNPDATADVIAAARPTHLLHLAWYVEHGKFWSSDENLPWVAASLNLVRAFHAAGGRRAVLAGTCAEYAWGTGDGECMEGVTPLRPATVYGATKDATRRAVEAYAEGAGLSTGWGRVFLLYGPGEPRARLVPSVITALLRGEPARCSHGRQVRDLLHVADVAAAFVALLGSEVTGAVNIASGEPVSLGDVAMEVGRRLGRPDLVHLGARQAPADDPPVLTASIARLRDEVGWTPRIGLRQGIDDAIAWWRPAVDGSGHDEARESGAAVSTPGS